MLFTRSAVSIFVILLVTSLVFINDPVTEDETPQSMTIVDFTLITLALRLTGEPLLLLPYDDLG